MKESFFKTKPKSSLWEDTARVLHLPMAQTLPGVEFCAGIKLASGHHIVPGAWYTVCVTS